MHEDVLKIDPLALDKEWLNQPGLYMFWAEKAVKAREVSDLLRLKSDVTQARVLSNIRSDPKKYGLDKVTESAINQQVLLSKDYIDIQKEYIKSKTEAERLSRFVTALEQRRKALENLCFLQNQGYYSQPQEKPVLERRRVKLTGRRSKDDVSG